MAGAEGEIERAIQKGELVAALGGRGAELVCERNQVSKPRAPVGGDSLFGFRRLRLKRDGLDYGVIWNARVVDGLDVGLHSFLGHSNYVVHYHDEEAGCAQNESASSDPLRVLDVPDKSEG